MSGGSYDYLCYKDLQEILYQEHILQRMSDRLAGLGYAEDAAKETEDLLLTVRQCKNRIESRLERLNGVWKAVEWWDSGDWRESQVKEALAQYRDR